MSMSYEDRRKLLESRLKPSRYRHSLGVADTAAFLAGRFGVDVEQARLAGLLHDCAREFPNDAMVAELAGNCKVRMVMADYRNIKITTPEDLIIGEAFLKN